MQIGCRLIGITFPFDFIYSILQVLGDSLRGAGKGKAVLTYIILIGTRLIRTGLLFLIVPRVNDIRGSSGDLSDHLGAYGACM